MISVIPVEGLPEIRAGDDLGELIAGSAELRGCLHRVDVFTSTLGKALGGASGGFTSGKKEIIDLLRNRSRPYLFSNTLAPPIVAGSLAAIALISESTALRDKLEANTQRFRAGMETSGLKIRPGTHPIVHERIADGSLNLSGWWFDIAKGEMYA